VEGWGIIQRTKGVDKTTKNETSGKGKQFEIALREPALLALIKSPKGGSRGCKKCNFTLSPTELGETPQQGEGTLFGEKVVGKLKKSHWVN